MTSQQEGSSGVSRRMKKTDRNRRSWTDREEAVLIASLRELIAQGFKSDNGFRAGYLTKLEEALKKEFPSTDLKGNPHINSKLCAWKKNYYSLTGILSRSGVGFNVRGTHTIDIEDDQWEQIVKVDPNARLMRYKSWPYYEVWKEIFGKDRANGEAAEDLQDAWNEMRHEDVSPLGGTYADYEFSTEDLNEKEGADDSTSQNLKTAPMPSEKQKKRKMSADMQGVVEVLGEIGRNTDARLASLAQRIGYEFDISKARKEAFDKLGSIPSLSLEQRFNVCEILGKNVEKMDIFVGLPEAARAQYVERVLRNGGN